MEAEVNKESALDTQAEMKFRRHAKDKTTKRECFR